MFFFHFHLKLLACQMLSTYVFEGLAVKNMEAVKYRCIPNIMCSLHFIQIRIYHFCDYFAQIYLLQIENISVIIIAHFVLQTELLASHAWGYHVHCDVNLVIVLNVLDYQFDYIVKLS